MKIVDGHTALVELTSTGANEALLVRNKFLAGALHHYFDLLWDRSTPLEINSKGRVVERAIPTADGLSAREQRIVLGLKSNKTLGEIAREVKISGLGPGGLADPITEQRQSMYANMIISQWQMSYETRSLAEPHLRFLAREFFAGTIGRDFWTLAREDRLTTSETRRIHRFHQILDAEYHASLATPAIPPPDPAPSPAPDPAPSIRPAGRNRRCVRTLLAAIATAAGAAAIIRVICPMRRP